MALVARVLQPRRFLPSAERRRCGFERISYLNPQASLAGLSPSAARKEGFALDVIGVPTQRASSGLALSSRNALLSEEGRARASQIYQALQCAKVSALHGDGPDMACEKGKAILQSAEGVDEEYFVVANRYTMSVNEVGDSEEWVVFCAAHVEGVRLIDNVEVFD